MSYITRLLLAIQLARASGHHHWADALESELRKTLQLEAK